MSLLNFPDSPFNGQIYPVVPLPNQTQYEWEAATSTWRIIRAGGGVIKLIAGPNINLNPPEGVGVVTISATGGGGGGTVTQVTGTLPIVVGGTTAFPVVSINPATTLSAGSLSAADKTKLDGLSHYTLPPATTTTLGGVIPDGTTISVTPSGAISVINNSDWLLTGSNLAPTNRANAVQVGGTDVNPAINLAADGRIRTVQTGDVGNVSLAVGGQTYGLYNPDATSIALAAGAVKKMQWDAVGVQLPGLANATQRTLYLNAAGYINAVDGPPGTVTEVTADLPLEVAFANTTPNITVRSATTSARGVVQLNDTNTGEGIINEGATANQIWLLQQQLDALPPPYVLPPATTTTLGGVIPDGVTVLVAPDGTISAAGGGGGTVTGVTGILPIVSSGGVTPAISINAATPTTAGSLSAADKQRIDKTVVSDVDLVPGSDNIYNMVSLSQDAYDALPSKSFDTLYIILQCDLPPYNCRTDVNTYCVTDFTGAWECCSQLTSFPLIDTSSGTIFTRAWNFCYGLTSFPLIDTSKGTLFLSAWASCFGLTSFPLLDTSSGDDFTGTWSYCSSLSEFPEINTSAGIIFAQTWEGCSGLTSFPLLDTSSGGDFQSAWSSCSSLESFPLLDTSSGMDFGFAWDNCYSLNSFPLIDVSSGTSFYQTWYGCYSLTSFPALNFSNGLDFRYAWQSCSGLRDFPANMFDTCAATEFDYAWSDCALSQTSVDNILVSLDVAGNFDGNVHLNLGTSSPPGPAGLAAKASLIAKRWNVFTN